MEKGAKNTLLIELWVKPVNLWPLLLTLPTCDWVNHSPNFELIEAPMASGFALIFLLFQWLLIFLPSSSLPLCTDLSESLSLSLSISLDSNTNGCCVFTEIGAPIKVQNPLEFCSEYNNGSTCCDSSRDLQLRKQFTAMNISDSTCASLLKSILCAVSSLPLNNWWLHFFLFKNNAARLRLGWDRVSYIYMIVSFVLTCYSRLDYVDVWSRNHIISI